MRSSRSSARITTQKNTWWGITTPAAKANAGEEPTPISPVTAEADHTAKAEDYDLGCAAREVKMEVERYRARSKGRSLMPLTYGLVALKALCSRPATRSADKHGALESAFTLVSEELGEVLKLECGRPIKRLLAEILCGSGGPTWAYEIKRRLRCPIADGYDLYPTLLDSRLSNRFPCCGETLKIITVIEESPVILEFPPTQGPPRSSV
ncbi:MAG: hypothetical protein ABI988_09290 [Nitrospirota bacterium]